MTRTATILAGLILAVGAMPLLADDVNIPPWRFQPRTTYQLWEFNTSELKPSPDDWYSPYYQAMLTITPDPTHPDWIPIYPLPGEGVLPREGVWALSGNIEVWIPNNPEPLEFKDLWLQLVWMPQENYPTAIPLITVQGVPQSQVLGGLVESFCAGTPWTYSWYKYTLVPNPLTENINIFGNILVDELVIDTRCAPEPATMGLLALGGLGMLIRRKR